LIKPAKLYLIRHAPVKLVKGFIPEHNPDAIIKKNQLKKLAYLIPSNCVWYVSPLKRAVQTAEALSKYVSYSEMILEKKLSEQNFGTWSGRKISEIWEIIKKNQNKHNYSFIPSSVSPPKGESFLKQSKRVAIWLENLSLLRGESILVVAHAGTIRAILSYALKTKPDFVIGIDVPHQSLSIFEMLSKDDSKYKGGRFRLVTLNKEI